MKILRKQELGSSHASLDFMMSSNASDLAAQSKDWWKLFLQLVRLFHIENIYLMWNQG